MRFSSLVTGALIGLTVGPVAAAQNTSTVFGPTVGDGGEVGYRVAYDPDAESYGTRLHVQNKIGEGLRLRGIVQTRTTTESDFDFDYVQAELLWQIKEDNPGWATGFRFDARLRGDGRPGLLRASWTNQYDLSDDWQVRGIVMTGTELGDDARDGVSLETRAMITRALEGGQKVGIEMYNGYGFSENLGSFDDQEHDIGPIVVLPLSQQWEITGTALFGVSEGAPDSTLRVYLTRGF